MCGNRIRCGKDTGLDHFPSRTFVINAAWLTVVMLASDLIAWTQRLLLDGDLAQGVGMVAGAWNTQAGYAGAESAERCSRARPIPVGHQLLEGIGWNGDLDEMRRSKIQDCRMLDCLIAAVAVRTGATLVHRDRDFDLLASALPDLHVRSLV
jgi:hypothetical protein